MGMGIGRVHLSLVLGRLFDLSLLPLNGGGKK
jgi:hypothetical protein